MVQSYSAGSKQGSGRDHKPLQDPDRPSHSGTTHTPAPNSMPYGSCSLSRARSRKLSGRAQPLPTADPLQ